VLRHTGVDTRQSIYEIDEYHCEQWQTFPWHTKHRIPLVRERQQLPALLLAVATAAAVAAVAAAAVAAGDDGDDGDDDWKTRKRIDDCFSNAVL